MRTLTCTLFASLLLAAPLTGSAEENESPFQAPQNESSPFQYEEKSPFTSEEKPATSALKPIRKNISRLQPRYKYKVDTSTTGRLLQQKALMQARQRRARIQLRKWAGKSSLRPLMSGERISPAEIDSVWSPWRWTSAENIRYSSRWK